MYYTGVGSRKTPKKVLDFMTRLAVGLDAMGHTLRTGDAKGADSAFLKGAGSNSQIFTASDATEEAIAIARKYHPAWDRLSPYAKKLHGRNVFQVLGSDLNTPSFVLYCWTPDGCTCHKHRRITTGGTGTAISVASEYGILVINIKNIKDIDLVI